MPWVNPLLARIVQIPFEKVENILDNEENPGDQHFLLFPPCFQEAYHQ